MYLIYYLIEYIQASRPNGFTAVTFVPVFFFVSNRSFIKTTYVKVLIVDIFITAPFFNICQKQKMNLNMEKNYHS